MNKKAYDDMILAKERVETFDCAETGRNNNCIVVASPGGGKSFSVTYPQLLHSINNSVVVSMAKSEYLTEFRRMFEERKYEVAVIDFDNPKNSTVGFDAIQNCENLQEIFDFGANLTETTVNDPNDIYWGKAAGDFIGGVAGYLYEKWVEAGSNPKEKPTTADFKKLFDSLQLKDAKEAKIMGCEDLQNLLSRENPTDSVRKLKTVDGNAFRTASCIFAIARCAVNSVLTPDVIEVATKKKQLEIEEIGKKKTALFVVSSPLSKGSAIFINMMYDSIIKRLFRFAQSRRSHRLPVPVHLICDDFACSGKIEGFSRFISLFRSSGISTCVLVQSLSQIETMYGPNEAATILNCFDRFIYLGGLNYSDCTYFSHLTNLPITEIMQLESEYLLLVRRGEKPEKVKRYNTLDDPLFRKYLGTDSSEPQI